MSLGSTFRFLKPPGSLAGGLLNEKNAAAPAIRMKRMIEILFNFIVALIKSKAVKLQKDGRRGRLDAEIF